MIACAICGQEASCFGAYENATEATPACDDCCGHACEDGHCTPLDELSPDLRSALEVAP